MGQGREWEEGEGEDSKAISGGEKRLQVRLEGIPFTLQSLIRRCLTQQTALVRYTIDSKPLFLTKTL